MEIATPESGTLFRVDGRVALITGASSGLGARFAAVLHRAGAHVVLTARRKDRLDQLAEQLGDDRVTVLPGDLRDPAVRESIVEQVADQIGRLDILLNNAGTCDGARLEQQSLPDLLEIFDLNLIAAVDLCRLAAPLLLTNPNSTVINVSSIYGLVGSREPMAAYNATKGALLNFTRHLAAQWGERRVRVNALAPGFFPTELTGELNDARQRAHIRQQTLLGRVPEISEIDGPLLFLASAAASYVTGQVLVVDGGWTAT